MKTTDLLEEFEQKLIAQRYSPISIQNYKSAVRCFLQLAEKKYR
jgi:integrase/recombinase XerD